MVGCWAWVAGAEVQFSPPFPHKAPFHHTLLSLSHLSRSSIVWPLLSSYGGLSSLTVSVLCHKSSRMLPSIIPPPPPVFLPAPAYTLCALYLCSFLMAAVLLFGLLIVSLCLYLPSSLSFSVCNVNVVCCRDADVTSSAGAS
jgi:hypothetical protein